MSDELLGLQVRRIDAPGPDLLAVTVSGRELRGTLLIGLAPEVRGLGFCERRPAGDTRSQFVLRAKRCLEGGRIVAAEREPPALVRLWVQRAGERHALEAELRGAHGNALLRDADGRLLVALHAPVADDENTSSSQPASADARTAAQPLGELSALRAQGERMLAARETLALERARAAFARGVRSAERRLERRLVAIEQDRARVEHVGELRGRAGLLLTHLHALARDASGPIELLDESVAPPARVVLEVDPKLGPQRQAEVWFQAARRLERGAAIASERARVTRGELDRIRALAERAARAGTADEIANLSGEARALGVAVAAATAAARKRGRGQERLPYRQFIGAGGRSILVGRGAEDNDRLTLSHARPHDLWLHARDETGAHVVVPLERNERCAPELLADAATLAAHFSRARGEHRVDVLYAERRYVRKPRKSPAGQVTITREKVFHLELQPDRLRHLLAAERRIPE